MLGKADELEQEQINAVVAGMDAWLDSMRATPGYGGPVVHWWQDCLGYAGAGLDWRYEGIILGYLNLYTATRNSIWLEKACRGGDDLAAGQTHIGNYKNSGFEMNPKTGGTPHEAAADLALFWLARELKQAKRPSWKKYFQVGDKNLQNYFLDQLWDAERHYFRNTLDGEAFVPNKAATIAEAVMVRDEVMKEYDLTQRFAIPTLDKIVHCQVASEKHRLDGAIDQSWQSERGSGRYFPLYISRCIPALAAGHRITGEAYYQKGAKAATEFILRERLENGSFPQVIYFNGRCNQYPQWVAGVGDILRGVGLMDGDGVEIEIEPTLRWLLRGILPSGAIRTAHGFGSYLWQGPPKRPDLRDVLPVCGWVDKAFRYLTSKVGGNFDSRLGKVTAFEIACKFRGQMLRFREDVKRMECWMNGKPIYRWNKGSDEVEIGID